LSGAVVVYAIQQGAAENPIYGKAKKQREIMLIALKYKVLSFTLLYIDFSE
jgi:hypothetical protein